MRSALQRLASLLASRPLPPLVLALLLLGIGANGARQIQIDPGNEALFLRDDPARSAHAMFGELFGGDEVVIVALQGPVMTREGLARLEKLTEDLGDLPGVDHAVSLTNARNVYQGPVEVYSWAPYEWVVDEERTVAEFAAEVLAEPLFIDNLVSRDAGTTAIVVTLEHRDEKLVESLRRLAAETQADGFEAHVAGFPVERYDFAKLIREDQQLFVPLIVLVIAGVSFLLFRQVWGVLLPLATVALSVTLTMAIAAWTGRELNAVTSLLTPVIMVVSVAVSMNLCSAYTWEPDRGAPAIARAWQKIGMACLFTTFTTAIGFGSLALSEVPAIRDFGSLSATGVGISYLAALLLLPPLFGLGWRRGPASLTARPGNLDRLLRWIAGSLERRYPVVLVIAALVVILALVGIAQIEVETDILAQLPQGSDLARATRVIDQELGGVNAVELLLQGEEGTFRQLEVLQGLASLQAWVSQRSDAGVGKTFSVVNAFERLHEVKTGRKDPALAVRALPDDQETLDYYWGILDRAASSRDSPVKLLISDDAAVARLSVRLQAGKASVTHGLIQELVAEARRLLPAGIEPRPAGQFVLIQNMTHQLPRTQLRSLLVATALIIVAIALLFGSLWAGALAALPAALPILSVYGIMGWTGVNLSTATSMIASVALGLAVDSTILFLSRYRDARHEGQDHSAAILTMVTSAGQAVSYSSLTLVLGFTVSAFSGFPPVRDFGLLTASTMAFSWLGAVFVLPSLILLGSKLPGQRNAA